MGTLIQVETLRKVMCPIQSFDNDLYGNSVNSE